MATKPEGMSDEMWAAVCIIMEDNQVKSYKEWKKSHQELIARIDEIENKASEREATRLAGTVAPTEPDITVTAVPEGVPGTPTPPPIVDPPVEGIGENGEEKGSGRGGRKRWYERDGYAK